MPIIEHMQALNYPANPKGVCHGIAYMAERARRIGQYDKFQMRMDYLKVTDTVTLIARIEAAKVHNKRLRNIEILKQKHIACGKTSELFIPLPSYSKLSLDLIVNTKKMV
jgi:hypothetical protein